MKKLFLLFALLAMVLGSNEEAVAQTAIDDAYEAFVSVDDDVISLTRLRDLGLVITARYEGFLTARIPNSIPSASIMAVDGVKYISKAVQLLTCSDSARYYSRVENVHLGTSFEQPYTGKGVIVGVIDCGFDFNHINFSDENGNTRVKAVYMPLDTTGRSPVINRIMLPGSFYETPEQIQALTTDDAATTHGTQTAGIAAGSYRGNGWYGMAPDADIVACGMPEGELTDVRIANCITYIKDYAQRKGKPCVVNISLGTNVGPHDGTSFVSRVCEQMSGPGMVFVVSAGNDGDAPVSIHTSLASRQDTVFTLLTGYAGGTDRSGYLNAWSKSGTAFNTRLIVVNTENGKILYRSRPLGATSSGSSAYFSTDEDEKLAQYYTGYVDIKGSIESNGMARSLCEMDMKAKARNYAMGFMYYAPSATDLVTWTSQYAYYSTFGFPWVSGGSARGSINDIATNDSVISVGSYNSKQYVELRDGTIYYRHLSTPTELSYYSSYGPDENGVMRPDVCAPGSVVISSANRYDVNAPNLDYWQPSAFVDGVEYPYCPDLGTSMSAPVVAGAVALWMEARPTLSAADVREVLKHTSYKDAPVVNGNRNRWGYGKLDVNAGMRYVIHKLGRGGDVNGDGVVNIADINALISVIMGGGSDEVRERADVNNDGSVNIADVNAVISIILD